MDTDALSDTDAVTEVRLALAADRPVAVGLERRAVGLHQAAMALAAA